ncbi:MAG: chemotaxis protein CheW [Pseudomonadota bacterium]|nr:chemotaxis protein CheW [Pseudomonadota bacterium]
MSEVIENNDNATETESQFVSFLLGEERFAFNMLTVGEIIRVPTMVKVPLGPPQMLGLANLRGNVLPVYDLQFTLMGEPGEQTDCSRVIVVESSMGVTGFLVDRVTRVNSISHDCIENDKSWEGSIAYDYLDGIIKRDKQPIEQILSVEKLVTAQVVNPVTSGQHQVSLSQAAMGGQEKADEESESQHEQLVCFSIEEQGFAFHLQDVEEIVRVPTEISALPESHPSVLGLVNLRGRIIPIVDLATNLGMCRGEINDASRIVIVNNSQSAIGSVGFVVSRVSNVISIKVDALEPVPEFCSQGMGDGALESVYRVENSKRLVSIVNLATIFERSLNDAMADIEPLQEDTAMNEAKDAELLSEDNSKQFVVFWIDGQEYGVSIELTQEITRVPEKLESVPNTPDYLRGVVNLRGTVLPVVDLRTRLGLMMAETSERQRIIVLTRGQHKTGFIVDGVAEVKTVDLGVIEKAPTLSNSQSQLLNEIIKLDKERRIIQLLDPQVLLADSEVTVG